MWRLSITLCLAWFALIGTARAEDLKPALTAQTAFLTPDGAPMSLVGAGEPFVIRTTVSSGYADEPPRGLSLFGWLRRIGDSDLPCGQAAEAFQRTGRLPTGTIFLNDPVIGVVTRDNAMILSDPEFSLASANIVSALRFASRPSAMVSDHGNRRFLIALPDEGKVVGIGPSGNEVLTITGLTRPTDLAAAPDGRALILLADGTLMLGDENEVRPVALDISALRPSIDPRWTVAVAPHEALLIDAQSGKAVQTLAAQGLRDAAVLTTPDADAPFALALLSSDGVAIHYLDAPEVGVPIALAAPEATRLVASPHGRVLLAWSPEQGKVNVIDVARGRLVRAVGANAAFSEVAFSDETAFLMLESQTHVGALDLNAIARGEDATFREIQIGNAISPDHARRQLLAPLWPMEGMLAVHADSYQGYRIMDGSVMGDAPAMTATSLRGGIPRLVATLDRSFVEQMPGVFETTASLPGPGRFELVATTGLGALSFCAEVPVADPDGRVDLQTGRLSATMDGTGMRFTVIGPDGKPRVDLSGQITFSALVGGWRATAPFATDAQGVSTAAYALPRHNEIVVRLDTDDTIAVEPLLLEDF